VRLNQFLARAAGGSRREADRWIAAGRVRVNGRPPEGMGVQVDPLRDHVTLDGASVAASDRLRYLAYYKPRGVLVSRRSQGGKPTIYDRLGEAARGLHPVGRLDFESEGLLLLTDDGPLAEALLHPRSALRRIYRVSVSPVPGPEALRALRSGVLHEGRSLAPHEVILEGVVSGSGMLRIELREGRKREIRILARAAGLQVRRLVRIQFGPVRLGDLKPGQERPLAGAEVGALRRAARFPAARAR
jgi:23S rRNA pseudouridine2605 synthase